MEEGEAGVVLGSVQSLLGRSVSFFGLVVVNSPESSCGSKKLRLLGFSGTWLFSFR